MGLFDDFNRYKELADFSADHMPTGFGFDPSVCEGCQYRDEGTIGRPCTLCGCPTMESLFLDMAQAPPADCVRLEQHRDISEPVEG